ncbi:MAG: FAD-binding protein [Chloroflexota bacterium]|nr:FAD-binding protein [Chloroflexota bacterium]
MKNWAGNYQYRARRLHRPRSPDEVQEIVRSATRIRALGSRHSFSDLADTPGDLLTLADLPRVLEVDPTTRSVTVDGALRYGELCAPLHAAGFALHAMASLPHISIAGACATATHGSGDGSRVLPAAVSAIEIVRADGEIVRLARDGDREAFEGAVVGLGALGIVTRLTLDIEPTFQVRQDVYEHLPLDAFAAHFDEITASVESVSFFTDWRARVFDQVWLKRRLAGTEEPAVPSRLHGAVRATHQLHPIRALSAAACTPQLGVPGPWHERLPHFRMDHTPSSGDELQSEYVIGREGAVEAIAALDRLSGRLAPVVQVSEIRTIAADELWLSPAYHRPSVAIHFTWKPDWESVRAVLPDVERALSPFEPRPHWAKLFTMAGEDVRARYHRMASFLELAARFDPEGKFRNDFLGRLLFADAATARGAGPARQ